MNRPEYEALSHRVQTAVAALSMPLSPEQEQRLKHEMEVIRQNRRSVMLSTVAEATEFCASIQNWIELPGTEGYCVSFVCWLLGISDFNPFDYPQIDTESFAIKAFKELDYISLGAMDGAALKQKVLCMHERRAQISGMAVKVHYKASPFKVRVLSNNCYGRTKRVIETVRAGMDPMFDISQIPTDDAMTFKLIRTMDWLGVMPKYTTTKQIEAVRRVKPENLEMLCEAELLSCRDTAVILMYDAGDHIADSAAAEVRCAAFHRCLKAYRLAYLKAHFSDAFRADMLNCSRQ